MIRLRSSGYQEVLMAVLPLWMVISTFLSGLHAAAILLAAYWGIGTFFILFRAAFPGRLLQTSRVLGLAVFAQFLLVHQSMMVLGVISVTLLLSGVTDSEPRGRQFRNLFFRGVLFAALLTGFGALREVLSRKLHAGFLEHPAGWLLLLAIAAALLAARSVRRAPGKESVS